MNTQFHPKIGQIEASIYNNALDSTSRIFMRLQTIADIIRTGRALPSNPDVSISELQNEARWVKEDRPHAKYQEWKAQNLPMFLITGCFSERKVDGLIGNHNSLINIDIDHIKNVEEMKQRIIDNEPALVLAGISPSGDGIKLIFNVTPTPSDAVGHKQIASQLQIYLSEKYNIPITNDRVEENIGIDSNGTTITFTCFFFHDPNVYINPNIPEKFRGRIQKVEPKNEDTILPDLNWNRINKVLDFITPDCTYNTWIDVGMALKHEGYRRDQDETFFNKWNDWSSGSETKYDPSIMKDKWESFNKDNTYQITLGSIFAKAKEDGWIEEIPRKDRPTRSIEEDLEDLNEQNLEEHLRTKPAEDADIARLLKYKSEYLLIVNNKELYIRTGQGSWAKIEIERSNGLLDEILKDARNQALLDIMNTPYGGTKSTDRLRRSYKSTNAHIKAVTGRLLRLTANEKYGIPNIKSTDFNNRIKNNPTLPLKTGAIDLKTGKILSPDEYAPYHVLETEFWAVEYDPDILNKNSFGCLIAKHLIENHYGTELLSRIAYHLVTSNKSVDIINIPTSSAGKTALVEWLKQALGNVDLDSRSRSLTQKGDNYTLATAPLTEHVLVFYDEVDKLSEDIPVGLLNEMTAEELTITKKYQNPTSRTRLGTGILMGADWPPIDSTLQGLDTRITYVYYAKLPPMSQALKHTLQSDEDAHKYLLAYVIKDCRKWANSPNDWENSPKADADREKFFKERTPEVKAILLEHYIQTSNSDDYVTSEHVQEVLSQATEKYPINRLTKLVTAVFPNSIKKKKRVKTEDIEKNIYVFTNLLAKPQDDVIQKIDTTPVKDVNETIQNQINTL